MARTVDSLCVPKHRMVLGARLVLSKCGMTVKGLMVPISQG